MVEYLLACIEEVECEIEQDLLLVNNGEESL